MQLRKKAVMSVAKMYPVHDHVTAFIFIHNFKVSTLTIDREKVIYYDSKWLKIQRNGDTL